MEFIHSDTFLIAMLVSNCILIVLFIFVYIKLLKLRLNYSNYMKKLGNGSDITEMIKEYINKTKEISDENEQIKDFLVTLNDKTNKCFQKTGMVRYNAFKDTGSNLSFALAILDRENNGIVLNGIYSRDTSNIYAKPVKAGKSEYKLSEEEEEAIDKAVRSKK